MSDHTTAPARPEPEPAVPAPSRSPLRYPPSPTRPAPPTASSGGPPVRLALDEDWAATVVGLVLRRPARFPTFVLGFLLVGPAPATLLFRGFAAT